MLNNNVNAVEVPTYNLPSVFGLGFIIVTPYKNNNVVKVSRKWK